MEIYLESKQKTIKKVENNFFKIEIENYKSVYKRVPNKLDSEFIKGVL